MAYINVRAIPMGSSGFDAIKTIQYHKINTLSSASFVPKSWLQRLFEQLIATVNQKGNPNA
ncbi:hypothetical protein [Symbiopectobacterium purcellii]|uniref:Uncharacterized protein n=1 Tax=Symbiopectobacterium purcellii TaxID=2871826 RepID=A0ABX9AP92_9ENTR|nr:hypothetical protein [Symbiopectobacterium purcellii]QZN96434.1 hypothetical protein K6K13_02920 [Symbiopectobacterium purcellii]QZN97324.1 hypothetical protein K6K13_08270 [Symbiopectobacterium purcellii]